MALVLVVLTGDPRPPDAAPRRRAGEASGEPPRLAFDAPRVLVGRGPSADLLLPDLSVSARHASLRQKGTGWVVVDEGSANGTFVGRARVGRGEHPVRSGDKLRLGRVWLEARIEPATSADASKARAREVALALVREGLRAAGEPSDARLVGPGGVTYKLRGGRRSRIGSADDADVVLAGKDVARRHAEVELRGGTLVVTDLGAEGGTFVRDERVEGEAPLARGEELRVGGVSLTFEYPALDALEELERGEDEPLPAGFDPEPPGAEEPAPPPEPEDLAPAEPEVALAPPEPPAEADDGWRGADLLILLVALAVLGASVVGWYLFR